MRKALIDAIHIRFRKDEKESLLYDDEGNAYSLPRWIDLAKQQRYISRHLSSELKGVKIFGDEASHDYMTDLQKEEVPPVFLCLRMVLSRLFYEE